MSFEAIFNHTAAPIMILRQADHCIVNVNQAWERLFGSQRSEVVGRRPLDIGILTEPGKMVALLRGLARTQGSATDYEANLRRRDGHPLVLLASIECAEMDGDPCFVLSGIDITERKRAEQEKRASDHRFATIFHSSAAGVVIVGMNDRRVIDVNESFLRALRLTRNETIGKSVGEAGIVNEFPEALEAALAKLRLGESVPALEMRMRRRDGVAVDFLASLDRAVIDGKPCFIFSTVDVTARRRTEEDRRASEARFATAFRHSPAAMSIVELADRRLIDVNDAWLQMLGRTRGEVIGRTGSELNIFPPEPAAQAVHDRIYADRIPVRSQEFQLCHRDGRIIDVLSSLDVVEVNGEQCLLTSSIDLTEYKKKERQLLHAQKMEAIGQLTGGIAHDFNNMLGIIVGNAELIESHSDPVTAKLAEAVLDGAERAAALTRQLLAISRRQPLAPEAVDPGTVLGSLEEVLARVLGETIRVRLHRRAKRAAVVDRGQLESAILNLAINARDAMPDGGYLTIDTDDVTIDESKQDFTDLMRPGEYLRIGVSDNGCGMSKDVLQRAFEPFFTTKEPGKGTGLGLSMVYGFVKQSGGHASIYSEPGVGTTVSLYLPLASAGEAAAMSRLAAPEMPPAAEGQTVVLVEDEPHLRQLLTVQLESLGYLVKAFADGPSALAGLESDDGFDVLVTDVVLPSGMNGRQLADRLAATRPDLRVLFASGYARDAIEAQGVLAPGVNLVRKPFRKRDLAVKLVEVLAGTSYRAVSDPKLPLVA